MYIPYCANHTSNGSGSLICMYVSMYLCIYVSMYVSMYVYVSMSLWFDVTIIVYYY